MDMEIWDCHCAICGRDLNSRSRIGSHQQSALRIRRELVRKRREGLPLTYDRSAHEPLDDEPRDWDWNWEYQSYDPELVSRESLAWMDDVACVGYNPDAPGENQCFLAEADPFENYCELILRPGDADGKKGLLESLSHTVSTLTLTSRSYHPPEPEKMAVFPFHGVCYSMLSRVQYATKHHLPVDPNLLYDTMGILLTPGLYCLETTRLNIDYGPLPERPQGCEPFLGEELGVTNPFDVAAFYNHLREKLAFGHFQLSPPAVVLGPASPDNDPFSNLSNELIREIALVVPYDSLLSLRGVSRPFYHDTRSNSFWRSRIANDMPWLWDLKTSLGTWVDQIDYMKLYTWLEVVTIPQLGMERPFLAIANRRRIWQCCREILSHSQDVMGLEYFAEPNPDMVANAQRPILIKVAPTQASRQDNISRSIWLYSEAELRTSRLGTFLFESFWNEDDLLCGIGVVFGHSRRLFGTRSEKVETTRLRPGDWIAEMTLIFTDYCLTKNSPIVGIKGINLQLQSELKVRHGKGLNPLTYKKLCVSEGKGLVGVEGQIRSDGVISRIGILEAPIYFPRPHNIPGPLAQRILWQFNGHGCIWDYPRTRITPIFPPTLDGEFLEDSLTPYQTITWADTVGELSALLRVTAFTPRNPADATERLVLGLSATFVQGGYRPKRYLGDKEEWPEDETTSLDLDGPLGEDIIEIGVSGSDTVKGLMLNTDCQSVIFGQGEPGPENWTMFKVTDGEGYINGIAATFETDPTTGAKKSISSILVLHSPFR